MSAGTHNEAPVAIAHDYLTQRGGAEKVVLALHRAFPSAPIYTTLYEPDATYPEFSGLDIVTSPLNKVGPLRRSHRLALPFLAWASNRVKVDARHTIVSTSGWAHGFAVTGSKIVYCYSPARWLYQSDRYLGAGRFNPARAALGVLAPFLRRWDKRQAGTATKYFAISTVVKERIKAAYDIDAEVLPAPHSVDLSHEMQPVDLPQDFTGFFLCISRLLPYKNVDAVIQAFNELGLPLVVVGAGPEELRLQSISGPTVVMLKDLSDAEMQWLYSQCSAVVSASYEDFGLTPIEGAAHGKPSIVLRWGGFLDTIKENVTGVYFDTPTPDSIIEGVRSSRAAQWDADAIREHALSFSEENFARRLRKAIAEVDSKGPNT